MILSLDNIPSYQNWLQLERLKSDSSFKTCYFAITEKTNRTDYPTSFKFINSDRYLERVTRQDQDCLAVTYKVNFVYCLRYKVNTEIDIEIYDPFNNLLAVHKIGKIRAKNNQIKLRYCDLSNLRLFAKYRIKDDTAFKQCLQLIDDLELIIVSSKLDNSKIDDTFLSTQDRVKRKCSKKSYLKNKTKTVPVKRSRSYEINYK